MWTAGVLSRPRTIRWATMTEKEFLSVIPLSTCHRSAYPVPFPITVHALTWFHSSLIEHTCNHLPPPFISSLTSVTHQLVLRLQVSTLVDGCPSILDLVPAWGNARSQTVDIVHPASRTFFIVTYVGSPALVIVNKLPFDLHPPVCLLWPVPWHYGLTFHYFTLNLHLKGTVHSKTEIFWRFLTLRPVNMQIVLNRFSQLSIILLTPERVASSESGKKYSAVKRFLRFYYISRFYNWQICKNIRNRKGAKTFSQDSMHWSRTVYKRKQFRTVLNKYVVGFWCERLNRGQGMDFLTRGSVIMDYGLVFWPEVMV